MQHKRLKLGALLLFGFGLAVLQAQQIHESILATGGNASVSGGSVSYSIGQLVYQTPTGTNGSVAQGVQQPYEISVITAIEETLGINLAVSVYPNPTSDNLTMSITEFDISNLSYSLYDLQGRQLQSDRISGNQTIIVMSNLARAIYFIKVFQGNSEVKTFKVIKN
jgi:hypothetical protein